MRCVQKQLAIFAMVLAIGGSCLFTVGCDAIDTVASVVGSINPCGTILACDAQEYAFITSGIDGATDPDIDPFCVFPPFCTADEDPIFGGLVDE